MMKKLLLVLPACLGLFSFLQAQFRYHVENNPSGDSDQWMVRFEEGQKVSEKDIPLLIHEIFPMDAVWQSKQVYTDQSAVRHHRMSQWIQGFPVLGGQLIVHEKNGELISVNGLVAPPQDEVFTPALSREAAQSKALQFLAIPFVSRNDLSGHSDAEDRLVLINRNYPLAGGAYMLAWELHIHLEEPHLSRRMYVDARNGSVLLDINTLMSCAGEPGTMHTLYHGVQDVETDRENNLYVTRDQSRGGGIQVQGVNGAVYTDDDNNWEAGSADQKNGVYDLFWGLQVTHDFFENRYGRIGANGAGLVTRAILLDTGKYSNAFWDGNLRTLNFGLGNGTTVLPFTSVDIVGHEFAHGVTQFTAGLEYLYESGALNEAFSDIFGKAIEYYYDQSNFNWLIGGKIYTTPGSAIRSMEDPNRFSNPKYYRGRSWVASSSDNGGVHSNSGVLNYWYYLLCSGGKGTNEGSQSFEVRPMGFDTATLIAYHLLRDFLTPTSTYQDARNLCMQMIGQWWGLCSDQYKNVAEAWKAVGLGTGPNENDLQLVTDRILYTVCKDGSVDLPTRLINHSCTVSIPAGTQFTASYQQDNLPPVSENFTLDRSLAPGDYFLFNFSTRPVITRAGGVRFTVRMEGISDSDTSNNRYTFLLSRNPNATEHDFNIVRITLTGSACPSSAEGYRASLVAAYNGCTVVPPGSKLRMEMKFDDSLAVYEFTTNRSLYPGLQLRPSAFQIPRNFFGVKTVAARLVWPLDTFLNNNQAGFQIVFADYTFRDEPESFTNGTYNREKIQIFTDSFGLHQIPGPGQPREGYLIISGSSAFEANGQTRIRTNPDPAAFMNNNSRFVTSVFLCAQTQGMSDPLLEFDLIQKLGDQDYSTLGIDPEFAVISRVIFRNTEGQILGTEFIRKASRQLIQEKISLSIPDGTELVEIQTLAITGELDPSGTPEEEKSDFALMDNIVIREAATSTQDVSDSGWMSLVPQPFSDHLSLRFSEPVSSPLHFQIIDLGGKVVKSFSCRPGLTEYRIEAGDLLPGLYLASWMSQDGQVGKIRIVKM